MYTPVYRPPKPNVKLDKINFNSLVPKGEVPQPPVMWIKPISSLGKLSLQFSKNMEYPKELKDKYEQDKKSWDTIYELLMNSPDDEE